MKKNFLRFAVQIVVLIFVTAISTFLIFIFFSSQDSYLESSITSVLQVIFSICLIVSAGSLVTGIPSFMVKLDQNGIGKSLSAKAIPWADVDHVKIVGMPAIKLLYRAVFSSRTDQREVHLFIFDNQAAFLSDLTAFLPWTDALNLADIPSEVRRPDRS